MNWALTVIIGFIASCNSQGNTNADARNSVTKIEANKDSIKYPIIGKIMDSLTVVQGGKNSVIIVTEQQAENDSKIFGYEFAHTPTGIEKNWEIKEFTSGWASNLTYIPNSLKTLTNNTQVVNFFFYSWNVDGMDPDWLKMIIHYGKEKMVIKGSLLKHPDYVYSRTITSRFKKNILPDEYFLRIFDSVAFKEIELRTQEYPTELSKKYLTK